MEKQYLRLQDGLQMNERRVTKMKFNIRKRFLSFLLALVMILATLPMGTGSLLAEETLSLNVNEPFNKNVTFDAGDQTGVKSNSYRIPSMVTLNDGTIVAAADIRWNTTYDGGGLDTLVARSTDGGVSWSYVAANYLGDNGNTYNGKQSTCFIDPCLTVAKDGQTVYMLVDLYPYGIALNGTKDDNPSTEVGFTSEGYLKLQKNGASDYGYYLKNGLIYSSAGNPQSRYTVDEYFNLYENDAYVSNLFFENSPFKVVRTGYLYLTKSTDGGASWSAPTLLNLKKSTEWVCLVGPGRGITTSNGTMIFPVYSYSGSNNPSGNTQRLSFIYSTDGVNWSRSADFNHNWASEAAVVEVNGALRFFFRNGTTNLCYVDYNLTSNTWGSAKTLTNVDTNSNTQISAITYSKTVDGKQVILVSCPTGSHSGGSNDSSASARLNGRIFVFTVEADGSLTKKSTVVVNDNESQFMYSCLTERSDGSVAILFEDKESAWGTGDDNYYTMDMKAFSSSSLGVTFDDGSGSVTPDPTPENPEDAYTLTLDLGQSAKVTVSETEMIGTDGSFVSDDGKVKYVVKHYGSTSKYQQDTDGVDSGSTYLIVCSGSYAVTTSSSSSNAWYVYSLPLRNVSFDGSETNYLWTITQTTGGYYIQNPDGQYMTFQTKYSDDDNDVTLSSTPFVCDITKSGNGYMIFADGTNIGLNNAGSSNKTAHGWPSSDNTVWSLYKYEQQGGTEVEFTGLDVTEGTKVTVGNVEYTVIVEPIESTESVFVLNSAQKTLDAVSDLGLTGSGYTVSYEIIQDENSIITLNGATVIADESNNGVAKVRATVKNSNGATVGTVEYTVSVSDVLITDTKEIFLAKGGNATIEGLTGELITSMLDTDIATVSPYEGTLSNGEVVITGVEVGMTSIVVGTVQFVIHVNPGTNTANTTSKYVYIYIDEITNCSVYYAINGGELHKIKGTGILIDQVYNGGFNIMFFATPDAGHALVKMSATGTADQYYSLCGGTEKDGSDTDAWPFDLSTQTTIPTDSNHEDWKQTGTNSSGGAILHGFRWSLIQGNMTIAGLRDLFKRAISVGAHGTTTFTKNDSGSNSNDGNGNNLNTHLTFIAKKLPELEKTIVKVVRDGDEIEFSENTRLRFGDVVTYQFKIQTFNSDITYTDIILKDERIGFVQNIPDGTLDTADQSLIYTAEYTINQNDASMYATGSFTNEAELSFIYKCTYSSGKVEEKASASVSCRISGIVYYTWMEGLPEGITADSENYPLPTYQIVQYGSAVSVKEYEGLTSYTVYDAEIVVGVWEFVGWEYNGNNYSVADTVQMPMNDNVKFTGIWVYTESPRYTVVYKWSNAPTGVVLPVNEDEYYENQKYTVDSSYYEGMTVEIGSVKYTFSGWKLNGTVVTGQQVMAQSNVVLVGIWSGETMYTSLTISGSGANALDKNQSFVYVISNDVGFELRVTVKGNGSTVIDGLLIGQTYTVTQESEWSWRYVYDGYTTDLTSEAVDGGARITLNELDNEITFNNERTTKKWLDGDSWLDNIFSLFN